MMFANATNFYRKSGVAQWRDLRFSLVLTQKRPDFCSTALSPKQSTSYIVKSQLFS
jgi:hypothetical protein